MKKHPTITLPGLVQKLGAPAITEALGCDRSLANKWAKGQRPGWRNTEALVALALKHGYTLSILGGGR